MGSATASVDLGLDVLVGQPVGARFACTLLNARDHRTQPRGTVRPERGLHLAGFGVHQQRARLAVARDDELLARLHAPPDLAGLLAQFAHGDVVHECLRWHQLSTQL
jgi:hypothetical protein